MIVRSLCNSCFQPFQLLLQASDVDLVKQVADEEGRTCLCPRLCGGRINLMGDPVIADMAKDQRLREPIDLTGKQLYQAINGMGLPDEVPKHVLTVEAMLKSNKVVGTVMEEVNNRIYLHELVLSNGITIHLAAGQRGAQVLRLTKGDADGTRNHR